MWIAPKTAAGAGAVVALVALSAGCSGNSSSPTHTAGSSASVTSSAAAPNPGQPVDYTKLLIKPTDIEAPMTFTATPPVSNPDGRPGAAITFSGPENSRVITDTVLVFADPAAATNALESAKNALGNSVNGTPKPVDVGTGGTKVEGNTPDKSRGKTVLLFTEGRAFVTIDFDAPAELFPPPEFVTQLGQKQAAAIKSGL
ncbi:hypothetical protein [Mycolicibacterium aichiense]|uniref:Lipoprotein LpqN n=1 Tax=Mycolicibacterium aichiense TaxID=1799 RepID=A0AAD1HNQ3_9MYCO|nr:hypothetical protein [Mycolicibacterium aichiense]MCV7018854.1 hypothetical protein [Mycolicibacterium aichiense]BBX08605.1 hypothetical protein MAIC_34080 [Mycolicibacterium aichiense]STZ82401.1 Uncharacterised protein [Mycolicibacterium aichiense]